jgi:hypothetical protein
MCFSNANIIVASTYGVFNGSIDEGQQRGNDEGVNFFKRNMRFGGSSSYIRLSSLVDGRNTMPVHFVVTVPPHSFERKWKRICIYF